MHDIESINSEYLCTTNTCSRERTQAVAQQQTRRNPVKKTIHVLALIAVSLTAQAQQTLFFQGNEAGNNWPVITTGTSATGTAQSQLAPNLVSGNSSLVVGGTSGGGSCIDGGSGNGSNILHQFTFSSVDISSSSNFSRTLTFHYGNRYPVCVGTGWDTGENLIFTPIHDGVPQTPVTLVTGSNNLPVNIQNNIHTYTIPTCVLQFGFTLGITTNRNDEFLFVDDVSLTTPQLNTANPLLGAITGPSQVCVGTTSSNYSINAIAATGYTWSGLPASATFTTPNSTSSSTQMTVAWGTTAPGIYTLSVQPLFENCGQTSTGASQQIQVELTAAPALNMSPNMEICAGESTSISVLNAGTFSWSNGLSNSTQHTVSPSETTTYTATGTIQGCVATGTVTITVKPNPVLQLQSNWTTICSGGSTTIQASGAAAYTFPTDPSVSQVGIDNFSVTPTTTTSYTVEGTTNGCSATQTITIQVNQGAAINAGADQTICAGETAVLSASGGVQYQWSGGATQNQSVAPITTTTYSVSGVDAAGCTGQDEVTIFVEANPTGTMQLSNTAGCVPYLVSLDIPGNQQTTTWTIGNQTLAGANAQYQMNSGSCLDVTVVIESANGCSTTYTQPDAICPASEPTAAFTMSATELTSENSTIVFTNESTGSVNQTWTFGDGSQSDLYAPTHSFSNDADGYWITLTVVNEFGCSDATQQYIPVTSISGVYVPNVFTPDGNEFNQVFRPIFTDDYDPFHFELTIFDRWGHILFVSQNPQIGWDGTNPGGYLSPTDTYIWTLKLKKNNSDKREQYQGHVQLAR